MQTQAIDRRQEVERLAALTRTFPGISAAADLAELAPHLTAAERDEAFGDYMDAAAVRDAACKACAIPAHELAGFLAEHVNTNLAVRAAGIVYPQLLVAAKTRTAISAAAHAGKADEWDGPAWDALDGLDRDVDGALAELADVRSGHLGSAEMPEADPERLEELAQEKVTAALANVAFVVDHRLDGLLVDFTVAAWRHADGARLRLTGGAL